MKKLIVAAIITMSAAAANAQPFDYERQFGTAELFPTIASEGQGSMSSGLGTSSVFAHERNFGNVALYPTLASESDGASSSLNARSSEPYNYWVQIWNTEVEIGG